VAAVAFKRNARSAWIGLSFDQIGAELEAQQGVGEILIAARARAEPRARRQAAKAEDGETKADQFS